MPPGEIARGETEVQSFGRLPFELTEAAEIGDLLVHAKGAQAARPVQYPSAKAG